MKHLNILKMKVDAKIVSAFSAVILFFTTHAACAQRLNKARTIMETIQKDLKVIIPVAAVTLLMCLAIGYAGRFIGKETFVRWAIGVIIAGSASQITNMLFN